MCIFTEAVEDVNSTRIFCRKEKNKQVIVYDMYLEAKTETAMVLPVPVNLNDFDNTVKFVDLSGYKEIFDDIEDLFPKRRGFPMQAVAAGSIDTLRVEDVGAYEASYVPTQNDFKRLDRRFHINENLFSQFPEYKNYGFVVFKLKPGKSQVHPMAFWFTTHVTDRLYFPTVHMHSDEIHNYDEFNHRLYAQGKIIINEEITHTFKVTHTARLKDIVQKSKGIITTESEIFKQKLSGSLKNQDTWFDLY